MNKIEGRRKSEVLQKTDISSWPSSLSTDATNDAGSGRMARVAYLFDLLIELVGREMKLKYKRSILGVGWTLLLPLLQLIVFSFTFRSVLGMHVGAYASYAFSGLLVWNWFQTSLVDASGCIIKNYALLKQPGFPAVILPVVSVVTWFIHFAVALPVLLVFLTVDGISLRPVILLLPLLAVLQCFFTLSLAYPLAALNVTFRDTQHTLSIILNLAFYVTPIFYTIAKVPQKYLVVFALNPLRHLLDAYRAVLLQGVEPNWLCLSIVAALVCGLLPLGHALFKRQSARFVEEL